MGVRLTKISSLKNLRNFIDFDGSSHELKRHEVLYAPNGSGKTNLTRILCALQNGDSLDGFKSKEAKIGDAPEISITIDSTDITHDNYTSITNTALLDSLVIFNSDYVAQNVTVSDFKKDLDGDVVLELGKEDTSIKTIEGEIAKERESIKSSVEKLETSMNTLVSSLKGATYKANEQNIWGELKLSKILIISDTDKSECTVNEEAIKCISEADYSKAAQERKDLLSLEGAEKISFSFAPLPNIAVEDITEALAQTDTFPTDDQEISNNVKFLSTLLHDHLAIGEDPHTVIGSAISQSEEKDKCILCKRDLDYTTKDLFKRYKEFFAGEKAKFEEKLRKYTQNVSALSAALELLSNDKKDRTDKLAELFGVNERWIDIDASDIVLLLGEIRTALEEKQSDLSTQKLVINIETLDTKITELHKNLDANKKLVDKLDLKSNDVATNLANARRKVGQMELSSFIEDNKADLDSIATSNENLVQHATNLAVEQAKAPKKSVRENTSKLFNHFMANRIGIDKYRSEIVDSQMVIKLKEFDISDSTHLISDGEQTMIGLAYFLASSIGKLSNFTKFSNAIFIIDDPVSSVSYSNLFGISSLLKKFQDDIKQELWKDNGAQLSMQSIILTHNIQFLNIMKTHVWKDNKKDKNHYGIIDSTSLYDIKIGRLLSEFQSALLAVYRENKTESNGLNICNDIRRIAETLRHFYGIKDDFNAESLKKIFPYIDGKDFENLFMVINHFSHGSPEDFDILPPNVVDEAVKQFVEIIEDDRSPFIDLWNETKELEEAI